MQAHVITCDTTANGAYPFIQPMQPVCHLICMASLLCLVCCVGRSHGSNALLPALCGRARRLHVVKLVVMRQAFSGLDFDKATEVNFCDVCIVGSGTQQLDWSRKPCQTSDHLLGAKRCFLSMSTYLRFLKLDICHCVSVLHVVSCTHLIIP